MLLLKPMIQKGSVAVIIILAVIISTIFAIGGFYIGRLTGSKSEVKLPIISNNDQLAKTTPSPISLSPMTSLELAFPSTCVSPPDGPICTTSASGIQLYKTLDELIKNSELIIIGHVSDSCLYDDLAIKRETSSQTPYVGHLVIEKSLKNTYRLEKSVVLTGTLDKFFNGQQTFSNTCVNLILIPGKSYLLFLKKHTSEKYYQFTDSPLEIQNLTLVKNLSSRNFFEQEIIQLGLDGLAKRISKLTQ